MPRGVHPDAPDQRERSASRGFDDAASQRAAAHSDALRELRDPERLAEVPANPSLRGGDFRRRAREKRRDDVSRLTGPFLHDEVPSDEPGERRPRFSRDEMQHQVELREGGAGGTPPVLLDHHGVTIDAHARKQGREARREPPRRRRGNAVEESRLRQDENPGARRADRALRVAPQPSTQRGHPLAGQHAEHRRLRCGSGAGNDDELRPEPGQAHGGKHERTGSTRDRFAVRGPDGHAERAGELQHGFGKAIGRIERLQGDGDARRVHLRQRGHDDLSRHWPILHEECQTRHWRAEPRTPMLRPTQMPKRSMKEDDPLEDFALRALTLDGVTKGVHVAGTGPAVIVMTEMPGISPHVARFSRWVRDAGFTVYMPSLFGRDGAVPNVEEGVAVFQRACVSAEFRAFATNESSPVIGWLRSLSRLAHTECGGPGVGAIGMCFTGNFALTMMLEPSMLAPVLSQPTLPLDDPAGMHIAPEDLVQVRRRLERDDLTVMAYRFKGDRFCTAQRFAAYSEALGERFIARVLPDTAANRDCAPFFEHLVASPHSVVTAHLIDEAGQPTLAARDEILSFFARRLAPAPVPTFEHDQP